ncbi:MAG: hypothetical protein ACRCXT_21050 [Paraclostridium sp.]
MTKKDIINKIINQANSLNKKIKTFKNEGIDDHNDFVQAMFNSDQMKYNKSGSMTKSKKFYEKQNVLQLQRTLATLTKINNHDVFGTINKYKSFATESWNTLQETIKDILLRKGYNEGDVNMIVSSKNFYNTLLLAFKDVSRGYGSHQIIEKVFLQYNQGNLSEDDIEKATSDIEFSVSRQNELEEHIRQYQEFLDMKRGRR